MAVSEVFPFPSQSPRDVASGCLRLQVSSPRPRVSLAERRDPLGREQVGPQVPAPLEAASPVGPLGLILLFSLASFIPGSCGGFLTVQMLLRRDTLLLSFFSVLLAPPQSLPTFEFESGFCSLLCK